jgi:isocitrate dehydrogenase
MDHNPIKSDSENRLIPDRITVPYITGDGIGREIMPVCRQIIDAGLFKTYGGSRSIDWKEVIAGERSFSENGQWLPQATLDAFREHRIGLKGPLTTPVGGGIRSINVAFRQALDLYVCLRPVRWFRGIASPLREPQKVSMVVFRENTEDIYAGIEWDQHTPEARKLLHFLRDEMGVRKIRFPDSSAFGIKPVSEEGSKRLVRAALQYALTHQRSSVTLVHKGNIMKFTEGGFRRWGYEVAEEEFSDRVFTMQEYERIRNARGKAMARQTMEEARKAGKVIIRDVIADAFLQNVLLRPEDYPVIATLNLNGDYISDLLAAMAGGIGMAPGANINYQTGHAIFEATHGTAPDIAGEDRANPSSLILSAAMMLEYLHWDEAARRIIHALETCFMHGEATSDLSAFMPNGQHLTTSRFRDALLARIENGT